MGGEKERRMWKCLIHKLTNNIKISRYEQLLKIDKFKSDYL